MTPLAYHIAKELTLPRKDRTFRDNCGLLRRMDDVHCFDVSEIFDAAGDLAEEMHIRAVETKVFNLLETQTFLPAPKTWLEWRRGDDFREGVLLVADRDAPEASCYWAARGRGVFVSTPRIGRLLLRPEGMNILGPVPAPRDIEESDDERRGWFFWLYAALAMINTPRIIGRRQHMPHRGLERGLLREQRVIGKFPLHAWTEILLHVTPPRDASDEPSVEAHYTGKRALHFCRAHLRIKLGRLELVKAHWRGDGSLGIKQSRYRVAA